MVLASVLGELTFGLGRMFLRVVLECPRLWPSAMRPVTFGTVVDAIGKNKFSSHPTHITASTGFPGRIGLATVYVFLTFGVGRPIPSLPPS